MLGLEICGSNFFLWQAMTLLQKNLEIAKGSLQVVIDDLQFLRDQVTITEVNQKTALVKHTVTTVQVGLLF